MEGHKKSRGRKNRRIFSSKRLTSFLLALAMICTNVIADLNTAYAAGASTEVAFEMRGADLVAAVEDAVASGNVVTPDDLNFTAGKAEEFKGYLFGTGTLYEAYPDLEGGDVNAEMRVFVRLPEDADDMYAVTGDEEIIFLYVNNSDETISFRSYISYTADGEEKIKKTDRVTVRSYESTFGDEEVNVISDPVEPETPAEVPDETEPETPETDPVATESELTVSMSPNVAAFVAVPGDELATPSDMPEASAPSGDESGDPDETDGSLPAEGNTEPEETTTADETTAPVDETKTPADPEELPAEGNEPVATEPEIPTAAKPNYGDLVAIGWSSTAKLYSSTLNKLHALDDVEGWEIRYSIAPEGAARIIDGPRGVEDGEDLYFGVKNQIGYAVDTVLANGEELIADTVTDNGDGSQTVWYNVPEVSEEQSIDVVMTESGEHPAFEQVLTMDDGMVITIRAEEGVLPAGVTATAARVSQEVEDEVVESASEEGKAVTSVYAYDINLWLGDQLLDSEIWGGSRKVEVTFSGQIVEEESQTADSVEVMYVETVQDSDLQAKEQVALQQETFKAEDVRKVETVSNTVEVPEAEMISEISFEAEHFSIYAYVGYGFWLPFKNMEMKVGDRVNVISDQPSISHKWTSSDPLVVSVKDTGKRSTTLSANAAGTAKITHKYFTIMDGWKEESVIITVVQPKKQFKVEWYINGNLSFTDTVQEGEKPRYKNGTPTRNGVNGKATFAGWATEPNSKEYKLEAELPAVTGDTKYYAVFTYDALFYFLLEGHSNTETAATSYMYAGPDYDPVVTPGKVIVPDRFTASSRWYVPNDLDNLEDYIVAGPIDDSIRKGLAKVYDDYDSSWKYNLNWTTLSYASPSVGYDYEIIKNDTVLHVDGAITLDRDNKVGLEYSVRMPDGSTIINTKTHTKGESVAINSTVTSTGSFSTDGYSYNAIETSNGQKYKFDGWYKDPDFSEKAGDVITVEGITSFYAKYVLAQTYSVTYQFDGTIPQNVEFVLPEQNEYVPKEEVLVDTGYTADTTVTNEIGTWKFSGWTSEDVTVENGEFSMPEKPVVFTGTWELISRAKYTLQVQHIYLDENGNREKMVIDQSANGSVEYNTPIMVSARNDEGYVYAGEIHMISTASGHNPTIFEQNVLRFNMPAGTVVLKLYYDADRNHDGVADKDQIKVTYKVVNGQWNDGTTEDIEEYVTITGEWASVNLPDAGDKPDSGYEAGTWSSNVPFVFTKANDGDVYTYTYGKSPYKLTVQHVYHDENGNSTTVVDETQSRENVAEGELVRVEKRDKEDYPKLFTEQYLN